MSVTTRAFEDVTCGPCRGCIQRHAIGQLAIAFGALSLIGPALEWFDRCYELNVAGHYLREEESRCP